MTELIDDWVNTGASEDDYVIERFEVRLKGKKPLVLNKPSFEQLVYVTRQYLNLSERNTISFVRSSVLDTPEPDLERYLDAVKTIAYLEREVF